MAKIENIRLEVVENGFKLCYTEVTPAPTGRTYDSCNYEYEELVYQDSQAQDAINKMIELRDLSRKNDKEGKNDDDAPKMPNMTY